MEIKNALLQSQLLQFVVKAWRFTKSRLQELDDLNRFRYGPSFLVKVWSFANPDSITAWKEKQTLSLQFELILKWPGVQFYPLRLRFFEKYIF